jgi:hypothetical protein
MNCYVCASGQRQAPAVAVCRHCFVGLCIDHLAESRGFTAGGMSTACAHVLPRTEPSETRQAASAP